MRGEALTESIAQAQCVCKACKTPPTSIFNCFSDIGTIVTDNNKHPLLDIEVRHDIVQLFSDGLCGVSPKDPAASDPNRSFSLSQK